MHTYFFWGIAQRQERKKKKVSLEAGLGESLQKLKGELKVVALCRNEPNNQLRRNRLVGERGLILYDRDRGLDGELTLWVGGPVGLSVLAHGIRILHD
jgi:hypothetical protein